MAFKKAGGFGFFKVIYLDDLSTFTTDSAGQLDVLWHDGDSLGVNGAQVGIFEATNQVCLTGFLEGSNS